MEGDKIVNVFSISLADTGARMDLYLLSKRYEYVNHDRRPMVVIFPGGGYSFLAEREAEPLVLQFNQAGYQACVVWYTVRPTTDLPALGNKPLREAACAVRTVREHAEEWGVDPDKIVVCGSSAGGHLAGSLGVFWNDPTMLPEAGPLCRPNGMILCYAVTTAGPKRHGGSIENLTGHAENHPDNEVWSLEKHVTVDTCPAFLWHAVPDDCVPVENALLMAEALQEKKVPFALHIFSKGWHGMSICTGEVGYGEKECRPWMSLALGWLEARGLSPTYQV